MTNAFLQGLMQVSLTVSAAALVLFALRRALGRRYPARAVCIVWAMLAVRLLVPVQLTLPQAPVQLTPPAKTLLVTYRAADTPAAQDTAAAPPPRRALMSQTEFEQRAAAETAFDLRALPLDGVLLAVWLAGVLLCAARQAFGYRRFRRTLTRSAAPAQREALRRVFEAQKHALGAQTVPLRVSPAADCPMLAGFARPTLYLPDETLSETDAAFIFRHELTHYKRRDLWLKLLLAAAQAVHWFNPLVHLLARFAQQDIERACDDAVVRGMDNAARRAYGETILRSAAAQVKKRTLVSCFTGEKEMLMKRLEGLFDARAKKRGAALIIAAAVLVTSLGCTVSVGGRGADDSAPDADPRLALAAEWAQTRMADALSMTAEVTASTALQRGEDFYAVADLQTTGETPTAWRAACRLEFAENERGALEVSAAAPIAENGAETLADFRILYENDIGLPDFVAQMGRDIAYPADQPDTAAEAMLGLHGRFEEVSRRDVTGDGADDLAVVRCTFADGDTVDITLANQFGEAWLPQDWQYAEGANARAEADLAQQYARAVRSKSGQFLYPVLSAEKQAAFAAQQRQHIGEEDENAVWYWRFGGSFPRATESVLLPGKDGPYYTAVFRQSGGGMTDYRTAQRIYFGQEGGRMVITAIDTLDEWSGAPLDLLGERITDVPYRTLFDLYYASGLSLPMPKRGGQMNGASVDSLRTPRDMVETAFVLGKTTTHQDGNTTVETIESLFTTETVAETDTDATVRLHFADGSPDAEVYLTKNDGVWTPVRIIGAADGVTATAGGIALPVGATVADAMRETTALPFLAAGDTVELRFDPAPQGEVVFADALCNADGTLLFSERETTERRLAAAPTLAYTVERHAAEELTTGSATRYRGVTVRYTDRSGTAHTAAFAFRMAPPAAYIAAQKTYTDAKYGYTLTLPDSFVGKAYVNVNDESVTFGLPNTDYGGVVMSLYYEPTAALRARWGEDWVSGAPMPTVSLGEHGGMSCFLMLASDVQYDPQDEAQAAQYLAMYRAAEQMDSTALSFDGQDNGQRENEREALLTGLAGEYSWTLTRRDNTYITGSAVALADDGESVTLVVRYADNQTASDRETVALRLWYENADSITPARQEVLADSAAGVQSLDEFLALYNNDGVGLPLIRRETVRALLADAAAPAHDPAQAVEWALGLAGGEVQNIVQRPVRQEVTMRYVFADRSAVDLVCKVVRFAHTPDAPMLYLPIRWESAMHSGGWVYDPYTFQMRTEQGDYAAAADEELYAYLAGEWADGAYVEGILYELSRRWQENPEEIDALMAGESSMQSLWQSYKRNNAELFA